jgi:glycerol-3-phosphate dehydrogenase
LSWKRFFRNQDDLSALKVENDLAAALNGVDALILAVPHNAYRKLMPEQVVEWAGKPIAVVDCFGMLDDVTIARYFELGCEVKGLGRGHIQRIKQATRKA